MSVPPMSSKRKAGIYARAKADNIARKEKELEQDQNPSEYEQYLVHRVIEAITNSGSHPAYHNKIIHKQRSMHPTLWWALDELVRVNQRRERGEHK